MSSGKFKVRPEFVDETTREKMDLFASDGRMNVELADGEKHHLLDSRDDVIFNPMEEEGDLMVGGENGAPSRLGRGEDGQILRSTEDSVAWDDETEYELPVATDDTLGGIKVGERLIMSNGVLSADDQSYELPTATDDTLGGIKVGERLTISDGVLSADDQSYELPIATDDTLGGIKVGERLTMSNGVLSADDQSYELPIATAEILGGIKVGERLTISDGVLSADDQSYELPIATASILGGIRPDGMTISVNGTTGVASVIGGGGGGSGMSNPMAAKYDIIYSADDFGTPGRLPVGERNTFLKARLVPSGTPEIAYTATTNYAAKNASGACYGNGYYVICGQDCIGYTPDLATALTTFQFENVAFTKARYLNGHFILLCGNGTLCHCEDPTDQSNWTAVSTGATETLVDVVYFGGYYVCAVSNKGIIYSSDLENWTAKAVGISSLTGIACSDSHIGVINGSSFSYCATVTGTWSTVTSIGSSCKGLAYGNGYWCAGSTPSTAYAGVVYSSDLTTWTGSGSLNVGTTYYLDFCDGNFALSYSSWNVASASNPTGSWASYSHPAYYPSGVSYANGYYFYYGNSAPYFSSTLGGTKTAISGLRVIQLLNAVVHGNDNFWYVAGDDGTYYVNSISSTSLQKGSDYNARGICIGGYNDYGGRYIATCGGDGIIRVTTSVWLSSFSTVSTGTTNDLNSIVYENGKYVAVGDGGTILVSTNINAGFSAVSSGTTETLTRVRYCNGYFIALGEGVILHSQNGMTWTLMRDVYGISFTDAAFSSGRYLIAAKDGNNGLLFTSQDPLDTFMAFEMAWYASEKPLLTISPLENTVIIAGNGGYAAVGTYTGYGPQFFEFEELETGMAGDIRDMVWTDTYVGAVVGENGQFALNRFSGGAGVALKYEPVLVATISSTGLIRPDNETTCVDRDGILSVKAAVADYAMPGKNYVALTPEESGATYAASATGWVAASGTTDGTSGRLTIKNTATGLGSGDGSGATSVELSAFLPVAAGDNFVVSYSGLSSILLRFIHGGGNS